MFAVIPFPQRHHLIRMAIRQRPEEHGIHCAENGSACADPEGQCQYRSHRESGTTAQHARVIADILHQRLQPDPSPLLAALFTEKCFVAELTPRRVCRIIRSSARPRFHLQMKAHLLCEVAVRSPAGNQKLQPAPELTHTAAPPWDPPSSPCVRGHSRTKEPQK